MSKDRPGLKRRLTGCAVVLGLPLIAAAFGYFYGFVTVPFLPDYPDAFRRRAEFSVGRNLGSGEAIVSPDETKVMELANVGPHGGLFLVTVVTRVKETGKPDRYRRFNVKVERGLFLYETSGAQSGYDCNASDVLR